MVGQPLVAVLRVTAHLGNGWSDARRSTLQQETCNGREIKLIRRESKTAHSNCAKGTSNSADIFPV